MSQVVGLDMVTGMGFIGLEPGRLYKIGQSPKLKDQTASGNPLLLNSAEAPLTALTLYGWSKQDGTPSPENPVPIVSAGDEGEINVTVHGGNLFDESLINDDSNFDKTYQSSGFWILEVPVPDTDVTISVEKTNTIINAYFAVSDNGQSIGTKYWFSHSGGTVTEKSPTFKTFKKGELNGIVYLYFSSAQDRVNQVLEAVGYIQINIGSTPLPYMPYKTPQTLTAQTPGGLPGIPVSSGGNYTDESGQQWICDEVDFKRGVYVQRVWKGTFDGSEDEAWRTYDSINLEGFYCADTLPEFMETRASLCNQLIPYDSISSDNAIRLGANNKYIYCTRSSFYDPSLEDGGLANWKAHLAAHPLEVMTYLETPIETDLTAEEMAAYKALHTYSPATTVSNDAGAWMGVGYKK